jgi:hypothetical protein
MYRPTVRYPDVYKFYVDDLFKSSSLDRNQIMRLALFTAAYSEELRAAIKPYLHKDVPLPSPPWKLHQDGLWLEFCF